MSLSEFCRDPLRQKQLNMRNSTPFTKLGIKHKFAQTVGTRNEYSSISQKISLISKLDIYCQLFETSGTHFETSAFFTSKLSEICPTFEYGNNLPIRFTGTNSLFMYFNTSPVKTKHNP